MSTSRSILSLLRRWSIAFLAVLTATLVGLGLGQFVLRTPFFLYLFAVMVTAWRVGTQAALAALILSLLILTYFFLPPIHSFFVESGEFVWLVAFAGAGSGVIWLDAARRGALMQQEEAIRNLKVALTQIKELKGVIPACGACKRVIDDPAFWEELKEYSQKVHRSEWICSHCAQTLFREKGGGGVE